MTNTKDTYCSFCGDKITVEKYPKECSNCKNITFDSPIVVVIGVIPINDDVLIIRRAENPQKDKLALPGGHLEVMEDWNVGLAREIKEELNFDSSPNDWTLFGVYRGSKYILIVGQLKNPLKELPKFEPNKEVSEITKISKPTVLAFPSHIEIVEEFFNK